MHNQQELLYRISNGDEFAFSRLYEDQFTRVYRYMESIVKSREIVEELVADIFMKLWREREQLIHIENIEAFLRVAARNRALDFLKTTSRKKRLIEEYYAEMISQSRLSAETGLLDSEAARIWREAVAQLSPQRQKVFLLHRENGLSYKEIASSMNISPTTVKKTMSMALESIREFLHTHYKDSIAGLLVLLLL